VLDLYEGNAFLNRLLLEAARQITFNMIVSLYFGHDETDRATWPTVRLLRERMVEFALSSPRRIEALVAQLVRAGFLKSLPAPNDRRVRVLTPMPAMLALDQNWLVVNYRPLQVMFPKPGYLRVINRDPDFQRVHRVVALGFSARGSDILASNPAMMLFLGRDAGSTILFKLVRMMSAASNPRQLSYADIGARFGVSRTHVRNLLTSAQAEGLVSLSGRGGRFVELKPQLLQAFDRFVAAGMSGHDLLYRIALARVQAR
jgi:biotin operon repressor